MEYLVYILASALAGIGTGLAGLSAATIMVPLLIVLCPSFSGQTGVYQATAIALASDILGSAVTTSVYIRHWNIDFKRRRIMMILIPLLCIVGSWAAYRAGNVVLGGFTLFLTFCIGIRFLLFPDTSRKESVSKDKKLGALEIGMSIFWGLSIGFGTGFVGTGGGMMMLVVFTAFLGMELKPAVGTSTFIMTFTALIASVSHMLIEPAIILERWDLCGLTESAFSDAFLFTPNAIQGAIGTLSAFLISAPFQAFSAMTQEDSREVICFPNLVGSFGFQRCDGGDQHATEFIALKGE